MSRKHLSASASARRVSVAQEWLTHLTFEYTVDGVVFFGESWSATGPLNRVGFRFRI